MSKDWSKFGFLENFMLVVMIPVFNTLTFKVT